jgi:lipopolysaccharide transport system ATP-binding protein
MRYPANDDAMIRTIGLGKAYKIYEGPSHHLLDVVLPGWGRGKDFWALRDIDLVVERSEAVGVIGRKGSGKSTLLQLICGMLSPSAGELKVYGRVAALLELGAGFNPDFTGRENVHLAASVLGLSDNEIAARFPAIAAFADIGDFIDQPVRHYSSGMYARLAFAVCAHVDADILAIDEILAVGDVAFQHKCWRFFNEFRKSGTLLFVSHDEAQVRNLCDRAVWLDNGILQAEGDSREMYRLYAREGTRPMTDEADDRTSVVTPPMPRDPRWHEANPIEISTWDPDAPWHGHDGARIEHVGFFAPDGTPLQCTEGGAEVELRIRCRATRELTRPIVGFIFRNGRGQNLFCDNTYPTYRHAPLAVEPGQTFFAAFRFQLPYLPAGDYFLAPSIIEGTQETHIHLHWIEEAICLRAVCSPIGRGLIGVPMESISLT